MENCQKVKAMKKTHYIILLTALLSSHFVVSGQSDTFISYYHDINMNDYEKNIVNGDTIYTYIPQKWELRNDTVQEHESDQKSVYGVENWDLSHIPKSYTIDHTKDIGEIAIHQGTASGALTYNVPIDAYSAANGMNPSVQLIYNSLSGNGVAGYGWHIGGLSAISACNSTVYYDNAPAPAKRDKTSAYMLDGMRLIDLKTGNSSLVNYETEHGNIKVVAY